MIFDENENHFDVIASPLSNSVIQGIAALPEKGIICLANNHVWYYEPDSRGSLLQLSELNFNSISSKKDSIWLASENSFYHVDRNGGIRLSGKIDENVSINSIFSSNNTKFIGTALNGLYTVTGSEIIHSTLFAELTNSEIRDVMIDRSNTLWIGTANSVFYGNLNQKKFFTINLDGLRDKFIKTLFIDNQTLFLCPYTGGIYKSQLNTQFLKLPANSLADTRIIVNDMKKFRDNSIYAATNSGLLKYNGSTKFERIPLYDHNIYSLAEDQFGNRYYGTYNEIIIQSKGNPPSNLSSLLPNNESLNDTWAWCIYTDSIENCVWLGTIRKGLIKLNQNDNGRIISVETYNRESVIPYFLPDKHVWDINRDKKGNLWIGTDAGLFRKNEQGSFEQIKIPLLENQKVISIVEDNSGCLWLSCSDRLLKYNPENTDVKRYTHYDGLQSNTFTETSVKAHDGRIYIAGINGVNYFYPEEIKTDTCKPQIAINNIRVHNIPVLPNDESGILSRSVNQTSELILNHKQNEFVLEFVAFLFANPEAISYKYILEGYDQSWITKEWQNSFAAYSNLPSGSYSFKVQAANADNIWGDTHQLTVTILPSPWKTWWAYAGYFLAILVIIGLIFYFIITKQKLIHRVHINEIERRQETELNESRLMFFTNVAHEFKTPLSLIIGPVNDLIQNGSKDQLQQFCFNVVSRNVKRLSLLVDQLLDFRTINQGKPLLNISKSDIALSLKELCVAFDWQASRNNINFSVKLPDAQLPGWIDRDKLNKVLFNILSNAFKNTPKEGNISVELKHIVLDAKSMARVIISDSGPGINTEDKQNIFTLFFHKKVTGSHGIGMHLAYQLVKAHKGTIEVTDSVFNGAEFIVTLPIDREDYTIDELSEEENIYVTQIQSGKDSSIYPDGRTTKMDEVILIVEDDHDLQEYLSHLLRHTYNVVTAQNGKEALDIIYKKKIDIIISDIMMPEMDGVELCKIIKHDINTSHIPVLLLTAKTDIEYQRIGLEAGAADYILKPFNSQTLTLKIDNIISDRKLLKNSITEGKINFTGISKIDRKILEDAYRIIQENMDNPEFNVNEFCKKMNMSRMTLHKKLKALTGDSATEFIRSFKIKYSISLMESGVDRVNEIAAAIGMSDNYFLKIFKQEMGTNPSQFIKRVNQN